MKNSCGAIFYAYDDNGQLGIILGEEGKEEWLPFKGGAEENESFENAAIREIREETCGLVIVDDIVLEHRFSTKRKDYYIGLCQVPYSIIEEFRKKVVDETRKEFKEKKALKFFLLKDVLKVPSVHSISRASIRYYWDRLNYLANNPPAENERMRCHGITHKYAEKIKKTMNNNLLDLINDADKPDLNEYYYMNNVNDAKNFNYNRCQSLNKKKNINRRNTLLTKPIRYNMRFTPNMDKSASNAQLWRRDV
jgi:hypothetical protein